MNTATWMRELVRALDSLRIRFLIGGSTASSIRAVPRATQDIDLLLEIGPAAGSLLSEMLGTEWYADAGMLTEAFRAGRSANVIYLPTAYKFDLFPALTAFDRAQLERAERMAVVLDGEAVALPVASAEDVILAKLRWMKPGGAQSSQQRRDVEGVLAVTVEIDWEYVESWAAALGISSLLDDLLGGPAAPAEPAP